MADQTDASRPPSVRERRVDAVVFDLDGVVRVFDLDEAIALERAHGVEPGAVAAVAEEPALVSRVLTGQITKAEWIAEVGRRLGSTTLAKAWGALDARLDDALVAVIDEVRAAGLPAVILTNGTDETPADIAALGLGERVDAVFNSAEIGHAKPDPRVFAHVCAALGLPPDRVAFTDDSPAKLRGASEIGMVARPYDDAVATRAWLVELGVLPVEP